MTTPETEVIRSRLETLRETLRLSIAGHEAESAPVALDQSRFGRLSRMDALQSQAMALETERRRKSDLVRVEKALERLDEGDYGYCARCDEEIAPARLEINPAAPLCIRCAR